MGTRYWTIGLLAAGCAGLCLGCSAKEKRRAVSGSVTFEGKPVGHGSITFLTTGGAPGPVSGGLIRAGRYDIPASQGLEPGTYRVVISWPGPGGTLTPEEIAAGASPRAKERIPDRYNSESTLTLTIKASGPNQFDFKLD
jgi:hypothetical protein